MPTARATANPKDTAAAVLAVLHAGPASAAEVAEKAKLGRSAAKTLAALAVAGRVHREPGARQDGRRLPDRWSLPQPTRTPGRNIKTSRAPSAERLGRGQLGPLVLAFLQAHPGEHSPTAVAVGVGGRSAGAVSNALARLADSGPVRLVRQRPRRYTAAED